MIIEYSFTLNAWVEQFTLEYSGHGYLNSQILTIMGVYFLTIVFGSVVDFQLTMNDGWTRQMCSNVIISRLLKQQYR